MKGKVIELPGLFNKQFKANWNAKKHPSDETSSEEQYDSSNFTHLVPVRYVDETRYDTYYVPVKGLFTFGIVLSDYIRIDVNDYMSRDKWLYYEDGQITTEFSLEQMKRNASRYLYLRKIYANLPIDVLFNANTPYSNLLNIYELPYKVIYKNLHGTDLPLSFTEPNEHGLVIVENYRLEDIIQARPLDYYALYFDHVMEAYHRHGERKGERYLLKQIRVFDNRGYSADMVVKDGKIDVDTFNLYVKLTDKELKEFNGRRLKNI